MLTINVYFLSQSTEMNVYHKTLKWLFFIPELIIWGCR